MSIRIEYPVGPLSQYVKSYWSLESNLAPGKEHIQRIVPNGLPELIIYLGDLPESMSHERTMEDQSLVSGQQNGFYDLRVTGNLSLFSIIFQPHGLTPFFDLPVFEFFNQSVPLRFLLKDVVDELEETLFRSDSLKEKIRIAESFLIECLKKGRKKYEFERISHSIRVINIARGKVDIDTLAWEACLGRKQFERTFQQYVGISPGKFLRTVRFQRTLKEKSMSKDLSLTEITHMCGYFDQSHMTHEFAKLSGMTPKKYFAECEPHSDYFQ